MANTTPDSIRSEHRDQLIALLVKRSKLLQNKKPVGLIDLQITTLRRDLGI
jgi:hypothetical protein